MQKKVLIIGGGVGGMSAAQELLDAGGSVTFDVHVAERRTVSCGGKARSIYVDDVERPLVPGAPALHHMGHYLAGEHGFRFFPGFYEHLPDTMSRIPYGGRESVRDNLVQCGRLMLTRMGKPDIVLGIRWPRSIGDIKVALDVLLGADTGLTPEEVRCFSGKLFQVLTSCHERRLGEYEKIPWWQFVEASRFSEAYRQLCVEGASRSLLANDPLRASARTVGNTNIQLLLDVMNPSGSADRVLNGPTTDVWLRPWLEHLSDRCHYHFGVDARRIVWTRDGLVGGVEVEQRGARITVTADYYVFALPVERMAQLLRDSPRPDMPADLAGIVSLESNVDWMNGLQFFLRHDVPIVAGHILHVDSPWSLTSISQSQFWSEYDLSRATDGRAKGVLSVCISRWDKDGIKHKKPARECTPREIVEEVWEQLATSFNDAGHEIWRADNVYSWALDQDLVDLDPTPVVSYQNAEPLFVNRENTWHSRPRATTSVRNLFLAADYVQTTTDVACMEAANEAARRAVNGILRASGSSGRERRLWDLEEPALFEPFRRADARRYARGRPWNGKPF